MSLLVELAKKAFYRDAYIIVERARGVEVCFPVSRNFYLVQGTPEQLNHIEVSPFGLHWSDLDEDLSFRGVLEGNF